MRNFATLAVCALLAGCHTPYVSDPNGPLTVPTAPVMDCTKGTFDIFPNCVPFE